MGDIKYWNFKLHHTQGITVSRSFPHYTMESKVLLSGHNMIFSMIIIGALTFKYTQTSYNFVHDNLQIWNDAQPIDVNSCSLHSFHVWKISTVLYSLICMLGLLCIVIGCRIHSLNVDAFSYSVCSLIKWASVLNGLEFLFLTCFHLP